MKKNGKQKVSWYVGANEMWIWLIFVFEVIFPNIFLVDPGLAAPGPEMSKLSCVRAMSSKNKKKTLNRIRNKQIQGVGKRKDLNLTHANFNSNTSYLVKT